MKHISTKLFAFFLSLLLFTTCVCAESSQKSVVSFDHIDLPNGDYIIEIITETDVQAYATNTKSGTKTATRYTSDNVALFSVTVTGTFSYNGSTSKATSASATVNLLNPAVSYVSKSAKCSGNSAIATGTTKYCDVTYYGTTKLSCSSSGVLS